MELRHQHKNERDVSAEGDRKKDDLEVRPRWPGKKSKTGSQEVDARTPDLKRIRAAIGALRGGGVALPGAMTREYSQLLGLDLSDVRIHRGGAAADAARSLDATAFTHGTDIAVADHLDLDSAFGRHVLAHELVHVVQNKRSNAPMDLAAHAEVGPSGSAIEQEAERGAAALTRGMSFQVGSHSRLPGISRYGNDENPPTGAASPVPVPGTNPPPVPLPPPPPAQQPTQAQPAATPAAPPAPATTPTGQQPRPTDQPAPTPGATPAAPQPGTPGYNVPSGSAPATNPTTLPNREPRPAVTPQPQPAPTPALSLEARVQQELEQRADPTLKAGYAKAIAGVDALRIQALQYTFTPNGVWNTLVETFTAKNAFQDHFGQIYSTNAYRGGNSWADTAQAWIEGLRGVIHIIGDVASVISAWAGLAALVTGALALILSETVIGGIALGAIAAIAAEVALVAGAIKLLTDIIDTLLGIIQMIILIVRARNSKDPAQRARFAQLLRKEANDFGANVVSIGVQVAVMAVSAGIGAGLSRGANSFMSAFKTEFSKMITPALKPWTLGNNFRAIANMARPVGTGLGVSAKGKNIFGQTTGRTVLNVEIEQNLLGISRLQRNALGRVTSTREIIPFTGANQMRGARLVTMRAAVGRAMAINAAGVKIGLGSSQLQADIKQPRDFQRGGTASSSPAGGGGRIDAPGGAGADLTKLQMWPSQIEAFETAKGPLQGAVDRTQRQYEMAEAQAGPELAAQVRTAFQGANNSAGQMRFGAMQVQTDAAEGQANTQRGLQQTTQARQGQDQMGNAQNSANTSVRRIQGEGAKLQSPPPKEGVLGWLYNQTIGRIGAWIGSAQRWVTNLVGKWAMSLAGFSKEEMDIAGIENDMREDDKKDQSSSQEAQDAAIRADQIQQTVFQLQENKTRDEQYAIQGMADAQRFIQALEDADRQLAAAIANGQSYVQQVTPIIQHELEIEQGQQAIDAAYVAPVAAAATAFAESLDASNVGARAQQQGTDVLNTAKSNFPDLDIGPASSAMTTAVGNYNTAFGQLKSQAEGQVSAMQTAIQAYIGTQDYDGVHANAAALDALARDFDTQAQALADQLYRALNSVIDQVNAHIQRAIDEASQVPDEQADPAAPAAPVDDQPTAPDDGATGFAMGYATSRKGIAPNPEMVAETKAPIADNAAQPAAPEPARTEQPAQAPQAEQPATLGGEQPAAKAGAPAPKSELVDNKPKGDAPKAPATAKPVGSPKTQATKSEADKKDEDRLDLPPAPASAAAASDDTEPAAESRSPARPRDRATAPQTPELDQPVAASAAPASSSAAAAKPKVDRKAARKSSKKGASASAMPDFDISEIEGVEEEGVATGEAEGDETSDQTETGAGEAFEIVDAEPEGGGIGEGQPGTASPSQVAAAAADTELTHTTEATATGASDDRTTVGVGEKVTFESTEAGTWAATSVGPGGRATKGSSNNYEWVAPATAGSSSITVTIGSGTAKTINMSVIAPSGIEFESPQEQSYPAGQMGAGMVTNIRYQPTTVSFYRTQWKEIGGPASGATGYFTTHRPPSHRPNPNWLQIGDDNGGPTDTAAFYGFPAPWTAGRFEWVIPNRYLVNGESGAGHEFAQVTQSCTLESDGTTTVTKGSASVTRSPGTAPARGGRGGGGGYGIGGGGNAAKNPQVERMLMQMLQTITDTLERPSQTKYRTRDKAKAAQEQLWTRLAQWEDLLRKQVPKDSDPESWIPYILKNYFKVVANLENDAGVWFGGNINRAKQFLNEVTVTGWAATAAQFESENDAIRTANNKAARLDANAGATVSKARARTMLADLFSIKITLPRANTALQALAKAGFPKAAQKAARDLLQQYYAITTSAAGSNEILLGWLEVLDQRIATAAKHDVLTREGAAAAQKWSDDYKGKYPARSPEVRETDRIEAERSRNASKKPGATPQRKAKEEVPTPKLDQAIDLLEIAIPALGDFGAPLEAAKAALELERNSVKKGEPINDAKIIGALSEATLKSIGLVASTFGKNGLLALQAAEQLGKLGEVFGWLGKAAGALENLSRALNGKTLRGEPVDINAQWDAWIDLVGLIPVIGTAVTVTKTAFVQTFNLIGAPIRAATDEASESDLIYIFNDKTPEQLKSELQALSTDPKFAAATIRKIYGETFTRSSKFNTAYSAKDQWAAFRETKVGKYRKEIDLVYEEDRWTSDKDATIDPKRTEIARTLQEAAIAFIDREVDKVRSNRATIKKY